MATIPRFSKPRAEKKVPVTRSTPVVSRRTVLLSLEGAGKTPCTTAAHSWIGCPSAPDTDGVCIATNRRCILAGYQRTVTESADLPEDTENLKRIAKPTNWSHSF